MSIPTKDSSLVDWSANANTRLTATPATYGTTAAIATQYDTLHDAFVLAYNNLIAARAAGTRSESLTSLKDNAKASQLNFVRAAAALTRRPRVIQRIPGGPLRRAATFTASLRPRSERRQAWVPRTPGTCPAWRGGRSRSGGTSRVAGDGAATAAVPRRAPAPRPTPRQGPSTAPTPRGTRARRDAGLARER